MSGVGAAVGVSDAAVVDLIGALAARGLTLATAESLTGGLLTAVLTEIPGSSAVVRGGLVVYATDLKHELADVDRALLDRLGPVDPEVAVQLARGARQRCGADVGVGLTGVAGPDPQDGSSGRYLVLRRGRPGCQRQELRSGEPTRAGTREQIRSAAVGAAIEVLANIAATDS